MLQALRAAWKANRHWVAGGFLLSTGLFLLFMYITWRDEQRGIAEQRATGLAAPAEPTNVWAFARLSSAPMAATAKGKQFLPGVESADRQIVRTGKLDIAVADPLRAAEQLREIATRLSGFVSSSTASGTDARTRSATVALRVPASRFNDARAEIRSIASSIERDSIEARDVTREVVDQEAALRNYKAEEAQYLQILKRAAAVKDVLEVTAKLADVRGRIDKLDAEMRLLRHEVQLALLETNITPDTDAQVFGIPWRPLYRAKMSFREALAGLTSYMDEMLALVLKLPVIVLWAVTVVALIKLGWIVFRRIVLLFFPGAPVFSREPAQT